MPLDRDKLWQIKPNHYSNPLNWRVFRGADIRSKSFRDYDDAARECSFRNFRDNGIRFSTNQDLTDLSRQIPVYDSEGDFIAHLDEPPFNYSYEELKEMPTIADSQYMNKKLDSSTSPANVWLDRMDLASYLDDVRVTATGLVPTRLVYVWDKHDHLISIYIASGESDGFEKERIAIWKKEIQAHI